MGREEDDAVKIAGDLHAGFRATGNGFATLPVQEERTKKILSIACESCKLLSWAAYHEPKEDERGEYHHPSCPVVTRKRTLRILSVECRYCGGEVWAVGDDPVMGRAKDWHHPRCPVPT